MDDVRAHFKHVEVTADAPPANGSDDRWMSVESSGNRMAFVAETAEDAVLADLRRQRGSARRCFGGGGGGRGDGHRGNRSGGHSCIRVNGTARPRTRGACLIHGCE